MLITRDQIVSLLKTNEVLVEFTKSDGTARSMRATLNPQQLPETEEKAKAKKNESNTVAVWDLDAEGWRSFKLETVYGVHLVVEPAATT